jgi:acetoin:2,6-dichlorophenolindophenol oxidoreductase subunit beta
MQKIKFSEAINNALEFSLNKDKSLIVYGLGVTDPKEIFNTTVNLKKKFGNKRVFDIPNSENALTGIGIGHALNGGRTIFTHQRLDFSFLSLDQIINNAAKIFYTSDGKFSVPITIRLIIGRGWGQGPNHSQALQSMYAHIPGLKVVSPSSPNNARELLISSIFDNNPVVFIEHRWLHEQSGLVDLNKKIFPIKKSNKIFNGQDLTIISNSIMTVEAIKACKILKKNFINCDLIDLLSINPLDTDRIIKSVKKTGKLIVLDIDHGFISLASEIISLITSNDIDIFKKAPIKITMPNFPTPTSVALTKEFYPNFINIINAAEKILNKKIKVPENLIKDMNTHDIPFKNYTGPF